MANKTSQTDKDMLPSNNSSSHKSTSHYIQTNMLGLFYSPCINAVSCCDALIHHIRNAEKSIHIIAFSLSSIQIIRELINAIHRNVEVEMVLERTNLDKNIMPLMNLSVPIYSSFFQRKGSLHQKTMIFDEKIVACGSFNFTYTAIHYNSENLTITDDQTSVSQSSNQYRDYKKECQKITREDINKNKNKNSFRARKQERTLIKKNVRPSNLSNQINDKTLN